MSRTSRRSAVLLLACLPLVGCASAGAADPGRPPVLLGLPGIVDSVRHTPPLDRTHWGIGAYDFDADRMLLRVNIDQHFVPASNMKLVTTIVALGLLGPEYRYTTRAFAEDLRDGVAGALIVRGSGDPTMSGSFHDGHAMAGVAALADSIAASGLRQVTGPLVIDATFFDDEGIHPTWEVGDLDWYYAAPVSAFAIDEGVMTILVLPGASVGDSARIDIIAPEGVVRVENGVTTDTAFSENTVGFVRVPNSNALRFSGRIPLRSEADEYHITVHDAPRYAARALAGLLRQRGIELTDSIVIVQRGSGDALTGRWNTQLARFTAVGALESPPMAEIVEQILEPSNNWMAEQVLKTVGAVHGGDGTWRAGAAVATRYLVEQAEIDSAAFHIVDGSGLSAQNLLSPDAVMRLLFHASEQDWGPMFRAALAEPGEEGSTLANRLATYEGRVFAKTGSITHVNSLSGYVTAADGREIIFSVLSNGSGVPGSAVRAGIDRIVAALAEVGAPPPTPVVERRLAP